ncbi:UbiA family prenyltransferase [archaeon]|nr:UbiA family prenyltransferase [archaeon]
MNYRTLIELLRPINGLMAGIGALTGFIVVGGSMGHAPFFAIVVPFLISSGGMTLNDYFDRNIDKNRPIQRKEITPQGTLLLTILLYTLGIALAFMASIEAGAIALLATLLLSLYDSCFAKQPLVGNIVVAANTGLTFVFGASFAGDAFAPIIAMLFSVALFSTLARETYKGIQDIEKDKGHRKTLAVLIGPKRSCYLAALFNITAITASLLPFLLEIFTLPYLIIIAIVDIGFFYTATTAFKSQNFYIQSRNMKVLQAISLIAFIIGVLFK